MDRMIFVSLKVNSLAEPIGVDTEKPFFSWTTESDGQNKKQTAYRVVVSSDEKCESGDMWDSGEVESDKVTFVEYAGRPLGSDEKYYWKVKIRDEQGNWSDYSAVSSFGTAFLAQAEFTGKWIAASEPKDKTWFYTGTCEDYSEKPTFVETSLPAFSKKFSLTDGKNVKSAKIYACGLGIYELYLNGSRVGEGLYEPGETDYAKEVMYNTFDVTSLLNKCDNAVGAMLGKAYYMDDGQVKYRKITPNYGELMFKMHLSVKYTDGTKDVFTTDESWVYNDEGPVVFSSWTGGEDYDARRELTGYSTAEYDRSAWKPVRIVKPMAERMFSKPYPPLTVTEMLEPADIKKFDDGVWLVDFGRNFAGVAHMKMAAPRGTTVEFWYSELLNAEGRIDQRTTGTPIFDTYIFKGEGVEEWQPRFCYHGFRYMEVRLKEGSIPEPTKDNFKGLLIRANNDKTGSFETDNNVFNVLHLITDRSIEANMYSTCTDCPHREKLGWQEVNNLMFDSLSANFDLSTWLKKGAHDTVTAQLPSGLVPDICPELGVFWNGFRDDPTWGGASVNVPLNLYKTYGDTDTVRQSYPTMVRYMDYLASKSENYLLNHGLGDWAQFDESTPVGLIVSCTYYQLAGAVAEVAEIIGKADDAEKYRTLAENIRKSFNEKYWDEENRTFGSGSQASNATPLYYDMVDEDKREDALRRLVEAVEKSNYHITTGEIALKPLIWVLTDEGKIDTLMKVLLNKTMPSYLYFVEQGATSLVETWDMKDSQLHCMMGHVEGWFYRFLAGIERTGIGYKTFDVKPFFTDLIGRLSCKVGTVHGDITVDYTRDKAGKVDLTIRVPFGTEAKVTLGTKTELCGSGEHHFSF